MAYFGVTASGSEIGAAAPGEALEAGLRRRLSRCPAGAPVVVLVHGFNFHPGGRADCDPHCTLFAAEPGAALGDPRVRSWPEGLGFLDDQGESGLCVGFAWPASAPFLGSLVTRGRTGFACVYERAGASAADRLAELVALLQRLAPGRPVDILAHSLGARVALAALGRLETPAGKLILLGAAELGARAAAFMQAAPEPPHVYNVTSRANDLYDLAFETFVPGRGRGERAVGAGLGVEMPTWVDLQLDRAEVTDWINGRGVPLGASSARLCHWDFYMREGALAAYQAILRRQPGWDVASLRAAPRLSVQEPRWSRLRPRLPAVPGPSFGGGLRRA